MCIRDSCKPLRANNYLRLEKYFAMSVFIVVGILFEEADLTHVHGDAYLDYCAAVPMLVPACSCRKIQKAS